MDNQNQESKHTAQEEMDLVRPNVFQTTGAPKDDNDQCIIPNSSYAAMVGDIAPSMKLRDWFAGQALVGVFTVDTRIVTPEDADRLANNCYILAEAMVRRSLQG